jgi:hypothetical protein
MFPVSKEQAMKETLDLICMTASDVARQRLDDYLDEKLFGEFDDSKWEFFTYLLEQAKSHRVDYSGFISFKQQDDAEEARRIRHAAAS